jgi:dipeptidyl aminopeptidase/acylaminoacyl peptidase
MNRKVKNPMKRRILASTLLSLAVAGAAFIGSPAQAAPRLHPNGAIIALVPAHVPSQSPKIRLFRMFYWSDGVKVEALVSEPKKPGRYGLILLCHGGFEAPTPIEHATSPTTLADLAHASPDAVMVAPQYRGYADSQGTVRGILGDTQDANNAIVASLTLPRVRNGKIGLFGTSMGGGVVLMLNGMRRDIAYVVATSPFVGWTTWGRWTVNHPGNALAVSHWRTATTVYHSTNPEAPTFRRRSPDITRMSAPVLLLQGTGDTEVVWQTVAAFYRGLQHAHKQAEFVLIPHGTHGLHGRYQAQADRAIQQFLRRVASGWHHH